MLDAHSQLKLVKIGAKEQMFIKLTIINTKNTKLDVLQFVSKDIIGKLLLILWPDYVYATTIVVCSRLSDSGEDPKVKGTRKGGLFSCSHFLSPRGPHYLGALSRLQQQGLTKGLQKGLVRWLEVIVPPSPVNGKLKQERRRRQLDRRKAIGLCQENNNFARASRFFVHFFAFIARLQRESA